MCGIYTVATSPDADSAVPAEEFRLALEELLAGGPVLREARALHPAMDRLREFTYRFLRPGPQIAVLRDAKLERTLRDAAARLGSWREELERALEEAPSSQEEEEAVNALLVGARDTEWQITRDILRNTEQVTALLGAAPPTSGAYRHAWHLNAILNNLDRLEVRGRDSAGIAAYVYFPGAESRDVFLGRAEVAETIAARRPRGTFHDLTVTTPAGHPAALLFAFKIAEEVGEMGQNVRQLREKIAGDEVFQAALRVPGTSMYALSHTRWASNGIISVPNCHPVDSTVLRDGAPDPESQGLCIAALNGDIDNYQELKREIVAGGAGLAPEVTTDAKIIPVLLAHLRREGRPLEEAFREMVQRFSGSFAIAVAAVDRPGELLLAQKGSGQGLFIGLAGESVSVASEMYGIVELTDRYVKAEGEKTDGGRTTGECFRIALTSGGPRITILGPEGATPLPDTRIRRAEITTRDIDRGEYRRYLLKEITESVLSVRKTLRGKIELSEREAHVRLGPDTLPPELVDRFRQGAIRRIIATGQGTAAVAAQGIAALMQRALGGADVVADAMKATELSGHFLRSDMSDTLVIAVSQSGTTTDTNRTVDLVRARGASVVGIVNRRNSDLVYKSDSVLYTSDGRDIEMSVASTKAFYAQNVAGQLLALALAERLGTLSEAALRTEIEALTRLPRVMERTLRLSESIRALASRDAPRRAYWAIVGTGAGKVAADEIRIKLSELCYKAIAVDYLEDKKHIDLSSEPLILVCATALGEEQITDVVKEVAIFKAHNSIPLVITEEGEERFEPYAAGCIRVPHYEGSLAFLLPTMVGHLFGYHAAEAFELLANRLRSLRRRVVGAAQLFGEAGLDPETTDVTRDAELASEALKVGELLRLGAFDSALDAGTAVKLGQVLDFLLGQYSLDLLPVKFNCPGTVTNCLSVCEEILSSAVNQLTRPIDAIKHQAKTVTVGISRSEEVTREGPLWDIVSRLELPRERVATSTANFLSAFGRLVGAIDGWTLYEISCLSPLGQVTDRTALRVLNQTGCAAGLDSRYAAVRALVGTKSQVVRERKPYLGFGQRDNRRILILPFVTASETGSVLLVHFALEPDGPLPVRLRALRADRERYNRLVASVTERDIPWYDELLEYVDNETLFLRAPEDAAGAIATRAAETNSHSKPA